MAPNSTIQDCIAEARREFGRATPYRVGLLVGRWGLNAACPYAPGSRGAKGYALGLEVGKSERSMDDAFNK
jgi:hypothetical protein